MASVNKVILIGNLTRDPVVRQLQNGIVVDFGMAMSRHFTNRNGEAAEETCFVDVSAFQRVAEVIRDYCHKGDPLFVEGRLKFDQWEDRNNPGQKRNKISVVAEGIQLLARRNDGGAQGGYQQQAQGYGAPAMAPQYAAQQPGAYSAPQYRQQPPAAPQYSAPQYSAPQPPPPPQYRPPQPPQAAGDPMPAFQPAPKMDDGGLAAGGNDVPMDDVPF